MASTRVTQPLPAAAAEATAPPDYVSAYLSRPLPERLPEPLRAYRAGLRATSHEMPAVHGILDELERGQ